MNGKFVGGADAQEEKGRVHRVSSLSEEKQTTVRVQNCHDGAPIENPAEIHRVCVCVVA